MSATAPSPRTLHGVAECIVALPYQLGYRPQSSLVLVCLGPIEAGGSTAGRGTVVLTARVDLPTYGQEHSVLEAVRPALRRQETRGMIALVFDEDGRGMARAPFLGQVAAVARAEHVDVCGLALVCGDHWLGLPVDDPTAPIPVDTQTHQRSVLPRGGDWLPLPAPYDVPGVATYVLAGRSPLGDRRGLVQLFRRPHSDLGTETAVRTAQLRADLSGYELTHEVIAVASATLGLVVCSVGAALPTGLQAADLACCAVALEQMSFRDAVLAALAPGVLAPADFSRPLEELLRSELGTPGPDLPGVPIRLAALAGQLPQSATPALLSVVGYLAWCRGEGALANIAIETALRVDPFYSLARLLDRALSAALRPPGMGATGTWWPDSESG